jgi:hypothetical protein
MAKIVSDANGHGSDPSPNEIARCAYLIWEREGRPTGREMQHWFEAEAQLRAIKMQMTAPEKPRAKTKPARRPAEKPELQMAT